MTLVVRHYRRDFLIVLLTSKGIKSPFLCGFLLLRYGATSWIQIENLALKIFSLQSHALKKSEVGGHDGF